MRHFLSLQDFTSPELLALLDRADELRSLWCRGAMPQSLRGHRVALWFYGQGFRNRLAFELGAQAMGAVVAHVPGELGIHEPLEDIADYLSNWCSMLVVRAKRHDDLYAVAGTDKLPVINARTDRSHPCATGFQEAFTKSAACCSRTSRASTTDIGFILQSTI